MRHRKRELVDFYLSRGALDRNTLVGCGLDSSRPMMDYLSLLPSANQPVSDFIKNVFGSDSTQQSLCIALSQRNITNAPYELTEVSGTVINQINLGNSRASMFQQHAGRRVSVL
jgi:hypothetical protein